MGPDVISDLQLREIFHIEFMRIFARKFKPELYALKGGVNLRLFFKSIRYSEDMDLDIKTIDTVTLRDGVMDILKLNSFRRDLLSFGIQEVQPPDISRAKQTDTTQRFKIHLITRGGEDLFTKIEFSRRGKGAGAVVSPVSDAVLRPYKLSSLLLSHYTADSAFIQKIGALAGRNIVQARDIFDLYALSTQVDDIAGVLKSADPEDLKNACDNVFSVEFNQFRDTVASYFSEGDRKAYNSPAAWDEIKLKVHGMLCQKPQ